MQVNISHLRRVVIGMIAVSAALIASSVALRAQTAPVWTVPEVGALPRDAHGMQVREGRDLITATYAHIGPNVSDQSQRFAGDNLACGNCHLQAGTKKFGLALFGLYGDFPQYSSRIGNEIGIEDRINACMTRSMNGRSMPNDAPAMQAIVAYIKFLSTGVPAGKQLPGLGTGKMPELNRAADPERGRPIYARVCAPCHNTNGSGIRNSIPSSDLGYMVPPLWGNDTFNDGAGLARLINFATYIHFNMPHGVDYFDPRLSVETPGTWRLTCSRSHGRTKQDSKRIFRTCC
jgi:thiosulfate dehydrogenase